MDERVSFFNVSNKPKSLLLVRSVHKDIIFKGTLVLEGPCGKGSFFFLEAKVLYIQRGSYQLNRLVTI